MRGTKYILIIDDEELVTKSLGRFLQKQGYNVEVALTGKEALERIKGKDFHLIISDVRMPDIDGIETVKNIREYLKANNKEAVPEIMITGYASEESSERAKELKVADYIYKPFGVLEFLRAVRKNIK